MSLLSSDAEIIEQLRADVERLQRELADAENRAGDHAEEIVRLAAKCDRLTRERDEARARAETTDELMKPTFDERDRLRAALLGLKDLTCGECVPCQRINTEIDEALSGATPPASDERAQALAKLIDLAKENISSHRQKGDGYATDPHVYNECEAGECQWCWEARAAIAVLSGATPDAPDMSRQEYRQLSEGADGAR